MTTPETITARPDTIGGRDLSDDELVTALVDLYRMACVVRGLTGERSRHLRADVRKVGAYVSRVASAVAIEALDAIEDVLRVGGPLPVKWEDELERYSIPSTPAGLYVDRIGEAESRRRQKG
jgi:hypothetical protein